MTYCTNHGGNQPPLAISINSRCPMCRAVAEITQLLKDNTKQREQLEALREERAKLQLNITDVCLKHLPVVDGWVMIPEWFVRALLRFELRTEQALLNQGGE